MHPNPSAAAGHSQSLLFYRKLRHYLEASGLEAAEASTQAMMLMEAGLGLDRVQLMANAPLPEGSAEVWAWAERVARGEPVQYVIGKTYFYGLQLGVRPGVLIPRPETEELVAWIVSRHRKQRGVRVLDIGTGSGCLAIALAAHLPEAQVVAWDVSAEALAIAADNVRQAGVDVRLAQQDVWQAERLEGFDLVVSNPPYVLPSDRAAMRPNVLDHEPHLALFAPEGDAVGFHRQIARLAAAQPNPTHLYLEIHESLGLESLQVLWQAGAADSELKADFMGKNRFVRGYFASHAHQNR